MYFEYLLRNIIEISTKYSVVVGGENQECGRRSVVPINAAHDSTTWRSYRDRLLRGYNG